MNMVVNVMTIMNRDDHADHVGHVSHDHDMMIAPHLMEPPHLLGNKWLLMKTR